MLKKRREENYFQCKKTYTLPHEKPNVLETSWKGEPLPLGEQQWGHESDKVGCSGRVGDDLLQLIKYCNKILIVIVPLFFVIIVTKKDLLQVTNVFPAAGCFLIPQQEGEQGTEA